MKRQTGSALLVVLLITAGLSTLLMRIHYRSSLLLETVREREKQIQWYYAAQTFMLYAIHLAKKNWRYIHDQSKAHQLTYHNMLWQVTEQTQGKGTMTFSSQKGTLHINVQLYDTSQLKQHLFCIIQSHQPHQLGDQLEEQVKKVIIYNWSEKHVA